MHQHAEAEQQQLDRQLPALPTTMPAMKQVSITAIADLEALPAEVVPRQCGRRPGSSPRNAAMSSGPSHGGPAVSLAEQHQIRAGQNQRPPHHDDRLALFLQSGAPRRQYECVVSCHASLPFPKIGRSSSAVFTRGQSKADAARASRIPCSASGADRSRLRYWRSSAVTNNAVSVASWMTLAATARRAAAAAPRRSGCGASRSTRRLRAGHAEAARSAVRADGRLQAGDIGAGGDRRGGAMVRRPLGGEVGAAAAASARKDRPSVHPCEGEL